MDVAEDDDARQRALLNDTLPGDAAGPSMLAAMQRVQKPIIVLVLGGMAFYVFMIVASGIAAALGF